MSCGLFSHVTYLLSLKIPCKGLVGKSSSSVRNSAEFAGFITTQLLQLEERFVSFYVVSLFIRIPIDLAISVAKCRQESDKTLEDRTFLSVSRIVALLKLCLEAMYLTFKGEMYQQVFRTAMGSPVLVVVVILVMEDVEERALASFPDPPKFWKR